MTNKEALLDKAEWRKEYLQWRTANSRISDILWGDIAKNRVCLYPRKHDWYHNRKDLRVKP
jgi:hypothetical protein